MKEYDVVIVGAGPAGSTFSWKLDNDYRSLLIDKRSFDQKKTCAGLLTERAIEYLKKNDLTMDEKVLSKPEKLKQVYLDWDNNEENRNGNLMNVDRVNFDKWLNSLIDQDVETKFNTRYNGHENKNGHLELYLKGENGEKKIKTSYLIGCDGSASKVRNTCDIPPNKHRIGLQKKTDLDIENAYFVFDEEINSFYSWLVPKGRFTLIGSSFNHSKNLDRFKIFESKIKERFGKFDTYDEEVAPMTMPQKNWLHFGNERVILCGEAAGLISPSSGEGISYALRSGDRAAKAFNKMEDNILNSYKESMEEVVDEILEKKGKQSIIESPEKRIKLFS